MLRALNLVRPWQTADDRDDWATFFQGKYLRGDIQLTWYGLIAAVQICVDVVSVLA